MTARIPIRSHLMTARALKTYDGCGKISLRPSEADIHRQVLDSLISTLEWIERREALIRGLIEFPDIAEAAMAEIEKRRRADGA